MIKNVYRVLALSLLLVAQNIYANSITYFPATLIGYYGGDNTLTIYSNAQEACDAHVSFRRLGVAAVGSNDIVGEGTLASTETTTVLTTLGYLNRHYGRCIYTYTRFADGHVFNSAQQLPLAYTCPLGTFTENSRGQQDPTDPDKDQGYDTCADQCTRVGLISDPKTGQCIQPIVKPKTPQLEPSTCKPINIGNGNKWLKETDYRAISTLGLIRNYSAFDNYGINTYGKNWASNHLTHIGLHASTATVFRSDASMYIFNLSGSSWITDSDIADTLVELKGAAGVHTGWTYAVDATGGVETYNAEGRLLTVTDRAGFVKVMTYSTVSTPVSIASNPDLPITKSDQVGRSLSFTYDASNRISTLTNPAGGIYTYAYSTDGNNNLISVTYPDSTVKTYHYEDTTHVNALTGVTDENGSRYMTYTYDANGRAINEISPSFGTNVNHYALNYNPGVSTTVTDPRGTNRTYNFTTILGVVKSTGTDQPAGAGCAASGSNLTYDANGNTATRNDFNGNQTAYVYDMARNLETSRSEGLTTAGAATAETRTIATTWHATWRLPLTISEYTGATATGTALKTTTYVYDDKGNITSLSIADPINNKTRTTSTSYTYSSTVPGLMLTKVIDGPRTDVSDITTYSYYPHDATCAASTAAPIIDPITSVAPDNLGCRGQVQSISNALNQTSTYDRYNHHGQVEQMTDANGLVTTSTYDLRQRITNRTVGTEATNFQYDNVGQLTQLTLPDNSSLTYTYDAAHRLTDITDNLGNKVHYTLDTQGNRINEDTTDPTNQLTKTLSRGYDALNRLEQLTGVE